jgi:glucosylceramidase
MKTARVSLFGLCFAIFVAACTNSGAAGNGPTGSTGAGGSNSCVSGATPCGSECVNTASDPNNCGACGISCNGGRTCQNSQCQCQAGLLDCSGSCVASDATHCGNCSTMCQANQVCSNNTCSSGCTGGQVLCGTACVDTTSSDANCGTCGHACGANQHCVSSNCVDGGTTGTGAGGSGGAGGSTPSAPKVITSAPSAYWNTSGTLTAVTSGTATVTVNDGTTMKTFEGFGGAFNEAGWNVLSMLSAADKDRAIKLLFDATDGAHFVMGRIPIGASDYALQRYTEDETANDTSLSSFSISRDMMYLIPYVKAAQAVNGSIRFWASPWTPPTWMKTNTGTVNTSSCARVGGTAFDGGCMQDVAANLTTLAQYFVKWVQAYAQQGITIETVAPQNEPNYAQGYPSSLWASPLYTKFVGQYLAPAFSQAQLSTKIMLGTNSNGSSGKDTTVVTSVMGDATAKGLVKVIGLQWSMLDNYKANPSSFDMYNLPIWATEHMCGNYPWNPSGLPAYVEPAPNNQAYGVESWGYIRDAIKAGVTAYNAWNMVLDPVGKGNDTVRQWSQDSLLVVNTTSKTLIVTPAYYVFRHVSQYVQPAAKVVATSGGDALAFKNPDGSVVAAMYNSGGASSYIVQIKGQKLQFSMPATGWATVVVP